MSVASLEARLSDLKAELRILEKREAGVESIIKKLEKKPASKVEDIKKGGEKTALYLGSGIKGIRHIQDIKNDLNSSVVSSHGLDDWSELYDLRSESGRLRDEIANHKNKISQVKADLGEARKAELEEFFSNLVPFF